MRGKSAAAKVPLYEKLAEGMIQHIKQGTWRPGERIPSRVEGMKKPALFPGWFSRAEDGFARPGVCDAQSAAGRGTRDLLLGKK